MPLETIHEFTDGDLPVLLEMSKGKDRAARFSVTYGFQVKADLTYAEAAKEYGECVFHSLACAGLLNNE